MQRWLVVLVAALLVGACADRGGNAGPQLAIVAPEDNAEVSVPFTLEVSTDAELGEDGQHLQVFIDGLEGPSSTAEAIEIGDLVPGVHKLHVTIVRPEGELALAGETIRVTVTGS